jgi:hypothetical protein
VSDNYTPGGPIKPPTGMTPKTFVLKAVRGSREVLEGDASESRP